MNTKNYLCTEAERNWRLYIFRTTDFALLRTIIIIVIVFGTENNCIMCASQSDCMRTNIQTRAPRNYMEKMYKSTRAQVTVFLRCNSPNTKDNKKQHRNALWQRDKCTVDCWFIKKLSINSVRSLKELWKINKVTGKL